MTYQEKQMAKLERFQELASKSASASVSARAMSDRISNMIPFGQPILVGHHSEGRHRRDIARIHSGMTKSIELADKAEYYENKVKNILNSTAISSDNPDAIMLLKEKLTHLEARRDKFKAFNKEARKNKTDQLPSYELSNLSQNIASVKKRIDYLEGQSKRVDSEEEINGVTLKIDTSDNRVKLIFPGKPSEEVRTKLKSNGFHWSPYNGAWQRQLSDWAISLAKDFLKGGIENGNNTNNAIRREN